MDHDNNNNQHHPPISNNNQYYGDKGISDENNNNSVAASFTDEADRSIIFMNTDDDDNASKDSTEKIITDAIQEQDYNENNNDDKEEEGEEVYQDTGVQQPDSLPGVVDIIIPPNHRDDVVLVAATYVPIDPQRMMKLQRNNNKLSLAPTLNDDDDFGGGDDDDDDDDDNNSKLLPNRDKDPDSSILRNTDDDDDPIGVPVVPEQGGTNRNKKVVPNNNDPQTTSGSTKASSSSSSSVIPIPKRNRLGFFNKEIGTTIRLTGKSSMDHMPTLYKRNHCVLCHCDTTVRCSTCQVQLCRNPFGNYTISCFERFHTETVLYPIARNGASHKNNKKDIQQQQQQQSATASINLTKGSTKSNKINNNKNNTKLQEHNEPGESEDSSKIVNQVAIPKRNRMEFFNNNDGRKLRLTANGAMDHMPMIYKRNKCLLCSCDTTVRCSTCQIQLCKYPFGTNTISCFRLFHETNVLRVIQRNGETHKQKVKVIQPTEPMPPVAVPKRHRIEFYNNEGKKYRLGSKSTMDHMPILHKRNKCLLCYCDTTVRCGTCQVQLCKYPFGNNPLSCFQSFHTEPVLIFNNRNGETSKPHKDPKGKEQATTTTTTDTTPPSEHQQMEGNLRQDCTNSTKPIIIKTKDMKRREQLQHRRKYKIEAKVPPFRVPKRNRIEFYNREGKKRRLSATNALDHLPIVYKRSKCLLCYCDTTVRCTTCQVQLCKNPFGTNPFSCFRMFHSNDVIQFTDRNGVRYKQKNTTETTKSSSADVPVLYDAPENMVDLALGETKNSPVDNNNGDQEVILTNSHEQQKKKEEENNVNRPFEEDNNTASQNEHKGEITDLPLLQPKMDDRMNRMEIATDVSSVQNTSDPNEQIENTTFSI